MSVLMAGGRRAFAYALLPLSVVPFVIGVPKLVNQYRAFARHYLNREALPAPDLGLTPDERRRWRPVADYRGAVPVLAYHGLNEAKDRYSTSRLEFARQMAMLASAGFHTISSGQYADFLRGHRRHLPSRPILITFDDGRLDTYRGADQILRKHGFRATNFVIAGIVDRGNPFYSRWDELQKMADSGRWDLQEHAYDGHTSVTIDRHGRRGPYYAYRRFVNGRLESFDAYKARVVRDIYRGRKAMRRHFKGFRTHAFAMPFGSYGQWDSMTNDRRIRRFLLAFLRRHFAAVFVQSDDPRIRGRTARGDVERFEVHTDTTADQLYGWLAARLFAARRQAMRLGEQRPDRAFRRWRRLRGIGELRPRPRRRVNHGPHRVRHGRPERRARR